MISCEDFADICKKNDFTFFTGVPDSTFKSWMSFLEIQKDDFKNIIAVNECEAIAICSGYHLSTQKIGVAYMQNSGLGKTVNPITSLADPEVYSIPILLLVGWRGEPGKKDEPQHKKMGRITIPLLKVLEIQYNILAETKEEVEKQLNKAKEYMKQNNAPYALIVREGIFGDAESKKTETFFEMKREDAIKIIIDNMDGSEIIISTTGKTSRELFEYRETKKQLHSSDFYTVGSMGCSSAIAFSIALQRKERKVFVFDGDGAALMQMGSFATIGHYLPKNFYHIIFDNNAHESTGGQPTVANTVNFEKIAINTGYKQGFTVKTIQELEKTIKNIKNLEGPILLVVKVRKGARADLGRPTTTPIENKNGLIKLLAKDYLVKICYI